MNNDIKIFKCPICGIDLVQEFNAPIRGSNFREIQHHNDIIHTMEYITEMDSDYQTYKDTAQLRPYKDGKVYRTEIYPGGGATGRYFWYDIY